MSQIVSVDVAGRRIPFSEVFPVGHGVERNTHHVFVRITTDDGAVGYGEGTSLPWFTGDLTDGLTEVAREWIRPRLQGKGIDEAGIELESLRERFPGAPGAFAAAELALLDLRGKELGAPLSTLLGDRYRDEVNVVKVLPAGDPTEIATKASAWTDRGYRHLKIKASGDLERDVARINEVLSAIGTEATLRVDANTSWNQYANAKWVLDRVENPGQLEYIEQPVDAQLPDHMNRLWMDTGIPVYADESVFGTGDIETFGRSSTVAGCHLKLAKSGSIRALNRMGRTARRHNMTVSIVSAFGTSLEATANLHLAAVTENLSSGCEICIDLLDEDVGSPGLEESPRVSIPTDPGIGVELPDDLF